MALSTERTGEVVLEEVDEGAGGKKWQIEHLIAYWSDPGPPVKNRQGAIRLKAPPGVPPGKVEVMLKIENPANAAGARVFTKFQAPGSGGWVTAPDPIVATLKGNQRIQLRTNPARRGTGEKKVCYGARLFVDGVEQDIDPDITIRDPGMFSTIASFTIETREEPAGAEEQTQVVLEGRILGGTAREAEAGRIEAVSDEFYYWAAYDNPDLANPIKTETGSEFSFTANRGVTYWVVLAHNPERQVNPTVTTLDRLVVRYDASSLPEEGMN